MNAVIYEMFKDRIGTDFNKLQKDYEESEKRRIAAEEKAKGLEEKKIAAEEKAKALEAQIELLKKLLPAA